MGKKRSQMTKVSASKPNKKAAIAVRTKPVGMKKEYGIHVVPGLEKSAASRLLQQVEEAQSEADYESENLGLAASAHALLHSLSPQDGMECMLAAQMTAVHNLAMECAKRALRRDKTRLYYHQGKGPGSETTDRNINRITKLMSVFTRQMEALQRYRAKGQQKIVVQHVQVGNGGQAIIGDIHPGGGVRG